MPLPSSGPISLNQVNVELGSAGTASISMNQSSVRTLFGKGSGAISMSDGYGKANQFAFTIAANQTNADLRSLAIAAGWNQSTRVVATINSGIAISSNSTGTPALTITGSFPGGVQLINNGTIAGMGGRGGGGANAYECCGRGFTQNGTQSASGGPALSVSTAVSINNVGVVAGGGGGGGGAGGNGQNCGGSRGGGGGGGGRSSAAANSAGGPAGFGFNGGSPGAGGAGTFSAPGAGGSTPQISGPGGSGGAWGSSGADGPVNTGGGNGPGSAGGAAVIGNGNITWIATGTRLGGIS